VLPLTVGIRDGVGHLVSTLGSAGGCGVEVRGQPPPPAGTGSSGVSS
jgi:hypothetical protein